MSDHPERASSSRLEVSGDPVGRLIELGERLIVTTERQTGDELRRCLAELHLMRAALRQAPDIQYVKDRSSRLVAVNQATADFHGFSNPSEMIGLTDLDLDLAGHAAMLFAAEQEIMRSGEAIIDFEEYYVVLQAVSGGLRRRKSPFVTRKATSSVLPA